MRRLLFALVVPSLTGTLTAQASPQARTPVPTMQTATFDIASAFQQRYRAMLEPLVFGRFTIGLSGEYTTEPDEPRNYYPPTPAIACPFSGPCGGGGYASDRSGYRAWSFKVHARWYPGALSYDGQRQSAAIYVGEFVGYHERRTNQTIYYPCPMCASGPDSAVFVLPPGPDPFPYPGGTNAFRQVLRGWEPGVELGVRVMPRRHIVMDVGGRFLLARLDDPQSATRPGGVDTRLVVSLGVGW